jgi:hypothetical protein
VSTEIFLECRSHTPPLSDGVQVGDNLDRDLDRLRGWLKNRGVLLHFVGVAKSLDLDAFDTVQDNASYRYTMRFILEHPNCEIGIRDEYGKDHPLDPQAEPLPDKEQS